MNILFSFLNNIDTPLREKLKAISPRGTTGTVWLLINEQVVSGTFDKKELLHKSGITTSHLDKITSELLARCYQQIFGEDTFALLDFLSSRVALLKLFYSELARQLKVISHTADIEQQAAFIKRCIRMIHTNMPLVYRDNTVTAGMVRHYISLFKGSRRKEAEYNMKCTLLLENIEKKFAAMDFLEHAAEIQKEFDTLDLPALDYSEETVFDYYWTRIYFLNALEDFEVGLDVAESALKEMARFIGSDAEQHRLRLRLKINEFLYYLSRFDEAYHHYRQVIDTLMAESIPDRFYHMTKYIQLCLITGQMAEADRMIAFKMQVLKDRAEELMIVRDIITYVKYLLFKGDYDTAFRFIQLGFEKNPKAKYFQYEIEFRNLQTACFYLSGQEDIAIEVSQKHIKFLRNNGYTTANSDYPYFHVLIKAIFEKKIKGRLSPRHRKMYDHYQQSSYAIYGRLLTMMLNK